MRMTNNILMSCFVLTAYGADLGQPIGISSASAHEALTNVSAYPTTPSTAKVIVGLTGFTDRPVSPGRPRNYPQETSTPLVRLATSPRPPPRFTDSIAGIDVQSNPNPLTDHVDPTPNTSPTKGKSVLIDLKMIYPAGHDPGTSEMENFMKRLTGDGPKEDTKPELLTPGQKRIWILFAQKDFPAKICGYGRESFYTMTRACTTPTTCTTPAYHSNIPPPPPPPPPMSCCCELLYITTVFWINVALFLGTACVFECAKFDKLTGVKIPCRELLFIFLTLFHSAPGAAATQGLADQSSIQVVVRTNASASTAMVAVDSITSWAQLVTACDAPSANITLSPAFKMGGYTKAIDFRLVLVL
jgi:hypothetical protein